MQRRALLHLAWVLPTLLLAGTGCAWVIGDTPLSTVHPATDAARAIQSVYKTVTIWIGLIFVVVEVALIWIVLRHRKKPSDTGIPEQVHGSTPLEVGWTLAPLVIVVLIALPSLRTTCALAEAASPDALEVQVTGKRWWFEFEYPEHGIVTANELHLPAGRMANLSLSSDNVIHSFWVPRLSGKRDLVPGRTQNLWFTPEDPGWYEGQCAELCGASHANMKIRVRVHAPEDFAAWAEAQKQPARVDMADPGVQAFAQNACFTCHAIDGSPWSFARIGPNLTHVASRSMIAGGALENTPENLKQWIRNAGVFKPGHASKQRQEPDLMWNFEHVPEPQLDALVSWLQGLK